MLRGLKDKRKGRCWLIVMAPTRAERDAWAGALGNVTVHIMDTSRAVCVERVKADPDRQRQAALMVREIDGWFTAFVGATRGQYSAAL